jgi:pimeloyl-ACP methyl ester carboxylesterase
MATNTGVTAAVVAIALAAVVLLATFLFVPGIFHLNRAGGHGGQPLPPGPYSQVNYTSSVDGAALSYYEWLPTGYDANSTYPLAVFLHGQYLAGNELIVHDGGPQITAAAQAAGFLLISINTPRTSSGFYVNSQYTGPGEQDVLDAITHEQSLRHVGPVYVFGSSMGTVGAYSLAGHHPGLFAGIGVLNSCPDAYENIEWRIETNNQASLSGVEQVTGGGLPGQTAYASQIAYYLSAARFYPQNYSHLRIYVTQGGNDADCPNNPQIWPYQNANNTVLTSTCATVPALGEPTGCTVPFANFSRADPSAWTWRFVYEPTGKHNLNEANATDLFAFWKGDVSTGLYWGGYPYGTDLQARSS